MKRPGGLPAFTMVVCTCLVLLSHGRGEAACVGCHTDETKIKSLYVPPEVEFKIEEGEG
jgi:hypothetical protein